MKRALVLLAACAGSASAQPPDLDAINAHIPAAHHFVAFALPHGSVAAPHHWRASGDRVTGKDGSWLEVSEGVAARVTTARELVGAYYVAKLADRTELETTDGNDARRFVVASPDHRRACTARIAAGADPFAWALIGVCRFVITSHT